MPETIQSNYFGFINENTGEEYKFRIVCTHLGDRFQLLDYEGAEVGTYASYREMIEHLPKDKSGKIKRGLSACISTPNNICDICPYKGGYDCITRLYADVKYYIEELEEHGTHN